MFSNLGPLLECKILSNTPNLTLLLRGLRVHARMTVCICVHVCVCMLCAPVCARVCVCVHVCGSGGVVTSCVQLL